RWSATTRSPPPRSTARPPCKPGSKGENMSTNPDATVARDPGTAAGRVLVPVAIGALVSLTLGLYAKIQHPTGIAVSIAGFSNLLAAKSWLATGAAVFAIVQLFSALSMYGKLGPAPRWIGTLHRWSGRIAFAFAIPVMVHCVYSLGFQTFDTRV